MAHRKYITFYYWHTDKFTTSIKSAKTFKSYEAAEFVLAHLKKTIPHSFDYKILSK